MLVKLSVMKMNNDENDEPIMLSALQHYSYCPRQCALIHVEQAFDENVHTMRGNAVHRHVDEPGMESFEGVRTEYALPVWSERLGLIGKCDAVEFHPDGRILLQLRGKHKYHGGGRWTTTSCSHPRVGETADAAAARRLEEEMGIVCNLSKVHEFVYKTPVGADMREHEYLHVYFGEYDGAVHPHPEEADGSRWIEPHQLRFLLNQYSRRFSPWFKITMQELQEKGIYTLL